MSETGAEGRFGKTRLHAWMNFLACAVIFTESFKFGQSVIGEIKLQYFITYPLTVILFFALRGFYLNLRFTICLILLTAATYWNVQAGNDDYLLMFKTCFGILQNALVFFMVLKANDFKAMPIFNAYMAICTPICLFGLIQEVAYLLEIKPIYNLSWAMQYYSVAGTSGPLIRVHSIMPEPAYLVFAMVPAVFAALHSWMEPEKRLVSGAQSLIIMTTMIFALSTLGYLSLGICLIVLMINFRKLKYLILISIAVPLLSMAAYSLVPDVQVRVDGTAGMLTGEKEIDEIDMSNFALFSNLQVAFLSFGENPWIGSGLGSHKISYTRLIGNVIDVEKAPHFLNIDDAGSMMLRLISETGILGSGMFLFFLFRNWFFKSKDPTGRLWVVNNGIFVLLVLKLIRYGNYFELGTFLFFWMMFSLRQEVAEAAYRPVPQLEAVAA